VQYHFKTDQGIKNLTRQEAEKLSGSDPDHATRDLNLRRSLPFCPWRDYS
jgi:catalase